MSRALIVLGLCAVLAVGACGRKGPLELPPERASQGQVSSQGQV